MIPRPTILLDPGHGIDTPGKRSPGCTGAGGPALYEWEFTRRLASAIRDAADGRGVDTFLLVPEDTDVGLTERFKRANRWRAEHPQAPCILYSLHGNAAGNGSKWMAATGWEAWTTLGSNNSDRLATLLYKHVARLLPNVRLRKDIADGDPDKEKNFTVLLGANCPAVLTENLFYDNLRDCEQMRNAQVLAKLAEAHVAAALDYFGITDHGL